MTEHNLKGNTSELSTVRWLDEPITFQWGTAVGRQQTETSLKNMAVTQPEHS